MNANHAALCPSPDWAEFLEEHVLGPLERRVELGADMLEIGSGPGAATRWLRHRVENLVALDPDAEAAEQLAEELAGTNVTVRVGDGTSMPFPDESFDTVGAFTMLHHLPTADLQLATLREAFRVLRPGGTLVGSDSLASQDLHDFHEGDTYNPIDPARLLVFLQAVGFKRVSLDVDFDVIFIARKTTSECHDDSC
ncbi:MAG TPA: class I SAM-dependent methyltransferase [Gaiellaceae bacterium]|nr:class I SAM-dependent methyltransferase [Gaiellaceae bacterium]